MWAYNFPNQVLEKSPVYAVPRNNTRFVDWALPWTYSLNLITTGQGVQFMLNGSNQNSANLNIASSDQRSHLSTLVKDIDMCTKICNVAPKKVENDLIYEPVGNK